MVKKLNRSQSEALYYIELDGGLMHTKKEDGKYTTVLGRPIHAQVANSLINGHHLIFHQDGFMPNETQTWEVKNKIGVERRSKGD